MECSQNCGTRGSLVMLLLSGSGPASVLKLPRITWLARCRQCLPELFHPHGKYVCTICEYSQTAQTCQRCQGCVAHMFLPWLTTAHQCWGPFRFTTLTLVPWTPRTSPARRRAKITSAALPTMRPSTESAPFRPFSPPGSTHRPPAQVSHDP